MSAYNRSDNRLLTEAYELQLLKESFSKMTLSQVANNIELLSESEAEYVCEVSERILEGFFGGAKNLFGAGKNAVKSAGQAVGNAAKSAGQAVGSAAQGAYQGAKNVASGVGSGIGAAAKQIGSNVKDIYNTGSEAADSASFARKAQGYVEQLKQQLEDAQAKGLITFDGPIDQISLGDIVEELLLAAEGNKNFAQGAKEKGFTGGAGKAFARGFKQPAQARTAPQGAMATA